SASFLPGPAISNLQLVEILKTKCSNKHARIAKLISSRLGINYRHFCRDFSTDKIENKLSSVDLGVQVIEKLLKVGCFNINDIGYLIGHTTTPATQLPPNTAWVADQLGLENPYMELRQACTGFANALQVAMPMLMDPALNFVAIVGTEIGSMYCKFDSDFMSQEQLVNLVQMGDGAGAVLLSKDDNCGRHTISDIYFGHIGLNQDSAFKIDGAGSLDPFCESGIPKFSHDVEGVRKRGEKLFEQGLSAVLSRGYQLDDFDFIIPHQVNGHLAKLVSKHLNVPANKVVVDADRLGNLGSAAIWVSLDRLINSGKLKQGNRVLVLGAEATKYMYGGFVYTH
ncbi:MAG: hypothetical protein OQJ89_07985, partial [Kangiellaceae bacterium]|nr:hypothetical protein [Kangiellaceae bacterium]